MSGNTDTQGITYHVTALQMPIYYNEVRLDAEPTCRGDQTGENKLMIVGGDHDHSGLMYALTANVPILTYLRTLIEGEREPTTEETDAANARAADLRLPPLPKTTPEARRPHPLVRPLVLRARYDDTVEVHFHNQIQDRRVGMHLVADGYDVETSDGALVGNNPDHNGAGNPVNLAGPGQTVTYTWECKNEGVFVFHDGGNFDGLEEDNEDTGSTTAGGQKGSSNLRGLFGALAVEPKGAIWRDPVTGLQSVRPRKEGEEGEDWKFVQLDGLYMDILFAYDATSASGPVTDPDAGKPYPETEEEEPFPKHPWGKPVDYPVFSETAHREYVIVFHDEPAFVPPHLPKEVKPAGDPCRDCKAVGHGGHGGGHGEAPPIMPISYRAEPMVNREQELFRLLCKEPKHDFKGRPVLNEEQHHSSWMFGDPATPILKAYIGDPVRIRLVHGGVKETHVFHLHLYEWHAAPQDRDSPRIDAISFSPQTGHTIEPVWGAGNRHQVAGDVIWHCHLYPHFHEGMWGMFRTFETLQLPRKDPDNGKYLLGAPLNAADPVYAGRNLNQYPDGTPIETLLPLPGRTPPPRPTPRYPGFPLYIPGECRQKSPVPPWPDRDYIPARDGQPAEERWCDLPSLRKEHMPADFDYRPEPEDLERAAFNLRPLPGELFTRNPFRGQQVFNGRGDTELCYGVGVMNAPVIYNHDKWVDPKGHFYYLKADYPDVPPSRDPQKREPLFFRAQQGQILNLTLENLTDARLPEDDFDHALPPCDDRPWEGECAMHVHMVKFDPICADGASTGWNYMSGARHKNEINKTKNKMVYRWWLDQEFGTIFFHDHLFANYRQKRGLFGSLIVEPEGTEFYSNFEDKEIISGLQARIFLPKPGGNLLKTGREGRWVREFCLALADFVPLYDRLNDPRNALNPPHLPGGHGDQGVMAINYRNEPITLRSGDPAKWFSSFAHGDPATTGFATIEDDPVWFRLLQGSHEEQHSFQIHAMRWLRFRVNTGSTLRNQQTFGISEAFTLVHEEFYGPGDYLYKLSGADDLWLGCWGLIRAFPKTGEPSEPEPFDLSVPLDRRKTIKRPRPLEDVVPSKVPGPAEIRHFEIEAVDRKLFYRRAGSAEEADIIDPFGLVYRVLSITGLNENNEAETWKVADSVLKNSAVLQELDPVEPLVIRCREGETVEVTLYNHIQKPDELAVEPHSPLVPLDDIHRPVSHEVSLHADLVLYDVRDSDGATVGMNKRQSVPPGSNITYTWKTERPLDKNGQPLPDANEGRPLGPVLLQDMADFRHHRHHGLVGALIIEARDAVPKVVNSGETTAAEDAEEAWHGARATVTTNTVEKPIEEMVLLMQDGLRLYWNGDTRQPLPDPPAEEGGVDYEDQGQKGFNYGTEPRGPHFDTRGRPDILPHEWLRTPTPTPSPWPATPLWHVSAQSCVHLHLIGACDKPRNHSFTIHGVAWPEFHFPREDQSPSPEPERCPDTEDRFKVAAESAVTSGTVRTFRFSPQYDGDHAYRSGALRWDVPQGMWGILRVSPQVGADKESAEISSLRAPQRPSLTAKVAWISLVMGFGWLVSKRWK